MARALHRLSAAALKRNKVGLFADGGGLYCKSPKLRTAAIQSLVGCSLQGRRPRPLDGRRLHPHREPGRGPRWAREQRKCGWPASIRSPTANEGAPKKRKRRPVPSTSRPAPRIHGRETLRVAQPEAQRRMGEHVRQIRLPDDRRIAGFEHRRAIGAEGAEADLGNQARDRLKVAREGRKHFGLRDGGQVPPGEQRQPGALVRRARTSARRPDQAPDRASPRDAARCGARPGGAVTQSRGSGATGASSI